MKLVTQGGLKSKIKMSGTVLNYAQFWKKTYFVFNVAKWKRGLLKQYFPDCRLIFLPLNTTVYKKELLIRLSRSPSFLVWGMTEPYDLKEFSEEFNIPIVRIEDGFFRSIGLGANHVLPYSFCIDRKGIYYNAETESDLENIIKNYDWNDEHLIKRSIDIINIIKKDGLSKYNEVRSNLASKIYGPKVKKRILVVGQVEDDQSLLYGTKSIITNLDLIELALYENPDAQIIYKPHPDVMHGKRKEISNINLIKSKVDVLTIGISLKDALTGVDRLYTITSLAGFEALLHGVDVTTVGAPFYSGWGLTDDRYDTGRRGVNRTIEQVFAAAYLLYPTYIHPNKRKKIKLEEVIEEFQEDLLSNSPLSSIEIFERSRIFNLATLAKINPILIKKSAAEKYVFLTDTKSSIDLINGLAHTGKNITVYTTRDVLANDESFLYPLSIYSNVRVISIHKEFSSAFSDIENKSVSLSKSISSSIKKSFLALDLPFLNNDLIESFVQGFESYIYFDVLRYLASKEIVENFDTIIINFSDRKNNNDVLQSIYINANKGMCLGKVYAVLDENESKKDLDFLLQGNIDSYNDDSIAEVRTQVLDYWWELQNDKYIDKLSENFKYIVCGNLNNDNYAYLPATLSVLKSLRMKGDGEINFVNSTFGTFKTQDEVRSVILDNFNSEGVKVYAGTPSFKNKYDADIFNKKNKVSDAFFNVLMSDVKNRFSYEFIFIYENKIKRFLSNCFETFIFISEAQRFLNKAELMITSMENSMTSRILVAIAKKNGVKTIGIQPQIISTSTRYSPPTVDYMGVIDSIQKYNFECLGYAVEKIIKIGSVNIFDRLALLKSYESIYPSEEDSILFAMQHSASKEMLNIACWLTDIAIKNNLKLYVKPHPHQELSVLNEVKEIMAKHKKTFFLHKESDTYEYISKSFIVVGLFSSVLYEAGIYGKLVIIATPNDVDRSIDFTQYGLALRAKSKSDLDNIIFDFKSKGENYHFLKKLNKEYRVINPHFDEVDQVDLISNFPV